VILVIFQLPLVKMGTGGQGRQGRQEDRGDRGDRGDKGDKGDRRTRGENRTKLCSVVSKKSDFSEKANFLPNFDF
jgi:hypothetical protein